MMLSDVIYCKKNKCNKLFEARSSFINDYFCDIDFAPSYFKKVHFDIFEKGSRKIELNSFRH